MNAITNIFAGWRIHPPVKFIGFSEGDYLPDFQDQFLRILYSAIENEHVDHYGGVPTLLHESLADVQKGILIPAQFQIEYLGFLYELEGFWVAEGPAFAKILCHSIEKIALVEKNDAFSDDWPNLTIVENYRQKRLMENSDFGTW